MRTVDHVSDEIVTAEEMRAVEAEAMAGGAVTGLELMERAGQGVVAAVHAEWPDLSEPSGVTRRAVVLCGPGNNGGDGFVIARLLADAGWIVDVFLLGDPARLPPDAKTNHDRWLAIGAVKALTDAALDGYEVDHLNTLLAIDALFGTGLTRPFTDLAGVQMTLNTWQAASRWSPAPRVVAVDIVSGVCADSGRYLGFADENPFDCAIMANLTVTFHAVKPGHLLAEGGPAAGALRVVDIGLSKDVERPVRCAGTRAGWLRKGSVSHKYRHGHAFLLAGGVGRGGAARMAARGALRIGAGLVTIGCPPAVLQENAAALDAIMLRTVADKDALDDILADDRINALCLGPGLGTSPREADLIATALRARRATVLDADALTLLAADEALQATLHEGCVLTPHMGEFGRLFPDLAAKLTANDDEGPARSKIDVCVAAAARVGCTVLLKGPDTVIADPAGRVRVQAAFGPRAVPWLATAGAGDVLAGFITGLLARGLSPLQAAEAGAVLHVSCARAFGPGLIAEDLPEMLPQVLREVMAEVPA